MQTDRSISKEEFHKEICYDINTIASILIKLAKKLNGSEYNNEFQYWEFHIFVKFIMNYCSIAHIRNGIPFPPGTNNLISDPFMLNTAIRTCLETYLLYQYIFCEKNETIKELRYLCWMKEGLQTRKNYLVENELLQETQTKDKANIKILEDRLKGNRTFLEYSIKRKKEILKGRNWKPSWNQLLKDSDLPKSYISTLYSSLSSYAHSESLSLTMITNNEYMNRSKNDEIALLPIVLIMAINVISKIKLHYNIKEFDLDKDTDTIYKWLINAALL